MDKTMEDLLSLAKRNLPLHSKLVTEGRFAYSGPHNPLNKLDAVDKQNLLTVLLSHQYLREVPSKDMESMERAAEVAREGRALAIRIETEVLTGHVAELLEVFIPDFREFHLRLTLFSCTLGDLMNLLGKPGHKHKSMSNGMLILASEFVRLRTGTYNDEHLAEIIQSIEGNLSSKDLSGDALRKRRENYQREHPNFYSAILGEAVVMASGKWPKPSVA